MKKIATLIIAFIFSILMLSAGTLSQIHIVISKRTSEQPSQKPRSIEFVPFYCMYDFALKAVYVKFLDNVGEVTIELTNLYTGEMEVEDSSSECGYVIVSSSGTAGRYILRISADNGDVYEGIFEIE